jgi:ketosteroid isomerase-like protein
MSNTAWLAQLFRDIDAKDVKAFAAYLTEDALFRFGNAPPVRGKEAVRDAVAAFFASVKALGHAVHGSWAHPDAVVMHGEVTYTRHDGSRLAVPFANVLKMEGSSIQEYHVFADASELYR